MCSTPSDSSPISSLRAIKRISNGLFASGPFWRRFDSSIASSPGSHKLARKDNLVSSSLCSRSNLSPFGTFRNSAIKSATSSTFSFRSRSRENTSNCFLYSCSIDALTRASNHPLPTKTRTATVRALERIATPRASNIALPSNLMANVEVCGGRRNAWMRQGPSWLSAPLPGSATTSSLTFEPLEPRPQATLEERFEKREYRNPATNVEQVIGSIDVGLDPRAYIRFRHGVQH